MDMTHSRIGAILATIPLMASLCMAQINIGDKLERKAKERLERKVDKTIDKGFDKTEEGVDKGAKEATKGSKDKKPESDDAADSEVEDPSGYQTSLRAYSKFDFVPGDQLIAFEDFSQDAVGDFPARWNTNSSGEVVTVDGAEGRWFKFGGSGMAYPESLGVLPEQFTLEFDVTGLEEQVSCSDLYVYLRTAEGSLLSEKVDGMVRLRVVPRGAGTDGEPYSEVQVWDREGNDAMSNTRSLTAPASTMRPPISRVSIQRQKGRLRMYLDEEKVWDLPRAFSDAINYRLVLENNGCEEQPILITNLRVAVGAPDVRNKLITDGRLVTHGILFDSGKDQVKPESYGTLKEIATALNENPSVKVRIIGHTDSDGDDAKNLDLSKRRAAAVKDALITEFKVDAGRMQTDGKGESDPAGPNDTPAGKANNRRVEFVKL